MSKSDTTLPTACSAMDWSVGLNAKGHMEVRIVLQSKGEAQAWAAWCFDHCGAPDEKELANHG